mgnify:CR=1 FL=1
MKCENCNKEVKKFGISECECGNYNFKKRPKKQAIDYDRSFANSMSDLSINQKMR